MSIIIRIKKAIKKLEKFLEASDKYWQKHPEQKMYNDMLEGKI